MNSDHLYMSLDWDDDSSIESDSGISSISSDSISSQFDHQDHSFINTVLSIAKDISTQSSIYSKALIDFTISGLKSSDIFTRRSAAVFLWQLFKACNSPSYDSIETKEKMSLLLKINETIVESLELALKTDSYSSQMLYWVSGCFHYISRTPLGCDQLLNGNIGLLISMLCSDLQAVVFYSITAIHNILLNTHSPFSGIHLNKCVSHILDRIEPSENVIETHIKLMAICIDCLSNLAYHNDTIKAQISAHSSAIGVILTTLLHNISNDKLLLLGMRLLKILSTDQVAKNSISESPVFHRLITTIFKSKLKMNSQIWSITFWTLRNLSDLLFQDNHLSMYSDILYQICDNFQQINRLENDLLLQCAAGILANASCDCQQNKSLLVKMKVHDTILSSLSKTKDKFLKWSGETLEAMYRCLHHLCSNHDKTSVVIERCFQTDIKSLLDFSETILISSDHILPSNDVPITWSILRAWLGLVRHLCIHETKVVHAKCQINQTKFSEIINLNLHQFQIQLESYLLTTNQSWTATNELPAVEYLHQLHSSILHIVSINRSHRPISF